MKRIGLEMLRCATARGALVRLDSALQKFGQLSPIFQATTRHELLLITSRILEMLVFV